MKRIIALVLCFALFVSCMLLPANAETTTSIEYFEDGSYVVTELVEVNSLARASRSGYKSNTYYNASSKKIYGVTVNGTFTYTNGVSVAATSSTATVDIYTSDAKYVSRNSYYSGATAYASSTFTYGGKNRTLNVSLTCDKYGNLS